VKKGELLMEIYSPEMVTEQRNLIFLLSDSLPDRQLISASRRKLLLLGMNEKQVDEVVKTKQAIYSLPVYSPYEGHIHEATAMPGAANEFEMNASNMSELALKEGMYIEKGQTLFNILDPHMVWVLLKIYADDAGKIKLHQPVELMVEGTENKWHGQIDFIEPIFQPDSKTLSARVYLGNEHHTLRVGMYVRATVETDSVPGIWIPKKAMLDLGKREIVKV
jgi:Cu(I)/Ag(I) efflux system membrane fusion protein